MNDEQEYRVPRVTWASDIEMAPVIWAWEDRIPSGSMSVAAGREGTGKSSFGIWMAAQITRGTLPGAFHGSPRRVLYVAVEDSWRHTLGPRFEAAGADRSLVGRFDVVNAETDDEVTLSLPRDLNLLERTIEEHGVALVVVDPLMSVIGAKIDTHRERDVRSALDPLVKVADRTGCIILGIAHFSKGQGSDAASLITGSGAFKNVPRSVFGFARDEDDENGGRVLTQVKNSLGRDDLPSLRYVIEGASIATREGVATTGKLVFTGESERSVAEILREGRQDGDDADDRRDAATFIREYLESVGGEAAANDVLDAGRKQRYAERTLKNARKKVATTSRQGFGPGAVNYWTLRMDPSTGPMGPMGPGNQPLGPKGSMEGSMEGDAVIRPCTVCGQAMRVVDPSQTAHPACEDTNTWEVA